jgi:hypothetical protein
MPCAGRWIVTERAIRAATRVGRHLARGARDVEFRARLGVALTEAASELARQRAARPTSAEDFRERLRGQLGLAAAQLAAERADAAPALRPVAGADFRGRLGLALASAGRELAGTQPAAAQRARWRPRLGWLPRLGRPAVVVGVLLCMAGGATASSVWLVQVGNPAYGHNPRLSPSSPPAAQLQALSVLRRPQSVTERGPTVQRALRDINQFATGVRTSYVRVLESTPYGPVVLVPVERHRATFALSGARPQPAIENALCVYYPGQGTTEIMPTSALCFSTQQLLDHQAYVGSLGHVFGLMPDGVNEVTVAEGATRLRATVRSNFFDVTARRHAAPSGSSLPAAPPIPSVTASSSSG